MSVQTLGISAGIVINQVGSGNIVSDRAVVMSKDGLGLQVRNLTVGTLYIELYQGNEFYRYENLTYDLTNLPGQGVNPNVTGSSAIFIQIPRGVNYRLASEGTTDLQAQITDTGNT